FSCAPPGGPRRVHAPECPGGGPPSSSPPLSSAAASAVESEDLTVQRRARPGLGQRREMRTVRVWHDGCSLPNGRCPGRGAVMVDAETVFMTGRAAFFALNGIVILLIAVYVAFRWR